MFRDFLIAVIAISAAAATAQTVDLKGRVLDKANRKAVAGATVKLAGSSLTATTDTSGRFTLKGNATSVGGPGLGRIAPPYFQGGEVFIHGAAGSGPASIEVFSIGGESLSYSTHPLVAGWNRVKALPFPDKDFLGFARISVGGETWVKRILHVSGHVQAMRTEAAPGSARTAALSKPAAAGNVEVSADRLVKKTVAFDNDVSDLGDIVLEYPPRRMDVGAPPIYGAYVLFDGTKGKAAAQAELTAKWQDWPRFSPSAIMFKLAKDPEFPSDTNKVTVQSCCNTNWGYDDIQAKQAHGDAQLHVEWIGMGQYDLTETPDIGAVTGKSSPGYINSGVYVQSRYEVQIESQGVSDAKHDMASLVDDYAPDSWTPNRGNGKWQAYDITFRSARYNASGVKLENARITVWWNGVMVHNNRDARAPATGTDPGKHSGEDLNPTLYGLKLQSEGRDVRYRNIWIKDLNIAEAKTDFGY